MVFGEARIAVGQAERLFQQRVADRVPRAAVDQCLCLDAVDHDIDYSREPWTTVTFTLEPAGRGTRLSMSETGFNEISLARRAKVFQDNSQGWGEVMEWIQKYAEAKN